MIRVRFFTIWVNEMANILVVEDEVPISAFITLSLRKAGYQTAAVYNGAEAAAILEKEKFDLILLDVMLPEIDGFTLMEFIRPLKTPVIFITAKNSLDDRVKGLKLGAEDYIVKPFEVLELLARVEVVLRRFQKTETVLERGGVTIDTVSMIVRRGGEQVVLTKTEYDLLMLFADNPGVALYRETIYERIWHEEYPYGSRTVDMHVQRLRKKLGWEDYLVSVNKVGYRLEVPR